MSFAVTSLWRWLMAVFCVLAFFFCLIFIRAIDDCHFVAEHLSDEQVMEAAQTYAYNDWLRREKARGSDVNQNPLISREEYETAFPNCCEILKETQMRPEEALQWKDKLWFALRAYVRIDSGHPAGRGPELVYIDACGNFTSNYLP